MSFDISKATWKPVEISVADIYKSIPIMEKLKGYRVCAFAPPNVGDDFLNPAGIIERASYDYASDCPRLILERIKRKVYTFRDLSERRNARRGDFIREGQVFYPWTNQAQSLRTYDIYECVESEE